MWDLLRSNEGVPLYLFVGPKRGLVAGPEMAVFLSLMIPEAGRKTGIKSKARGRPPPSPIYCLAVHRANDRVRDDPR